MSAPKHAIYITAARDLAQLPHPGLASSTTHYNSLIKSVLHLTKFSRIHNIKSFKSVFIVSHLLHQQIQYSANPEANSIFISHRTDAETS